MDTGEFAQPGFDVKAWINALCSKKPAEEALDKYAMTSCLAQLAQVQAWAKLAFMCRYLSQTEMRLHLASEDVEASLEAEGSRAVRRMPLAATEIAHLQVLHCLWAPTAQHVVQQLWLRRISTLHKTCAE